MTEEINPFAHYVHEPEGSVWISEPNPIEGISPEEWEAAAKTLNALGQFAHDADIAGGDVVSHVIIDAEERVRIQARRAREEGWEEPKDGEVSTGQHDRITRLIERCDHLSNAVDAALQAAKVERDKRYAEDYILGTLVPFLEAERDDARNELRRYKREIGLLGEE
ncbi:MAG: hypothetical protein M3R38_26515 [Actinomycetota bacterium]|nr:hypothetical protein [Actinomycetota bacterium]